MPDIYSNRPRKRRDIPQLSTYDRGLIQAVSDGRLSADDEEVAALVARMQGPIRSEDSIVPMSPSSSPQTIGPPSVTQIAQERVASEAPPKTGPLGRTSLSAYNPTGKQRFWEATRDLFGTPGTGPNSSRYSGQPDAMNMASLLMGKSFEPVSPGLESVRQGIVSKVPEGGWRTAADIVSGAIPNTKFDIAMLPFAMPRAALGAGRAAVQHAVKNFARSPEELKSVFRSIGTKLTASNRAGIPVQRILVSDEKRISKFISAYPEIEEYLPFLHASELSFLTDLFRGGRKDSQKQIKDFFNATLTPEGITKAGAEAGIEKFGWYANARKAIEHIYGKDAKMFGMVAAAFSPRVGVKDALKNAVRFFENWKLAGRPTSEEAVRALIEKSVSKQSIKIIGGGTEEGAGVLNSWNNNTVRAVRGLDVISGPKVNSFGWTLGSEVRDTGQGFIATADTFTGDAWVASSRNIDQTRLGGKSKPLSFNLKGNPGFTGTYLRLLADARRLSREMKDIPTVGIEWTASELQETEWSYFKSLYELSKKLKMSAKDIVKEGRLTKEIVEDTVDIGTLFKSDPDIQLALSYGKGNKEGKTGILKRLETLPDSLFGPSSATSDAAKKLGNGSKYNKGLLIGVAEVVDNLISRRSSVSRLKRGENLPGEVILQEGLETFKTGVRPTDSAGISIFNPGGLPSVPSGVGARRSATSPTPVHTAIDGASLSEIEEKATTANSSIRRLLEAPGVPLKTIAVSFEKGLPPNVIHVRAKITDKNTKGLLSLFPESTYEIFNTGESFDIIRKDGVPFTPKRFASLQKRMSGLVGGTKNVKVGSNISSREISNQTGVRRGTGALTKEAVESVEHSGLTRLELEGERIKDVARDTLSRIQRDIKNNNAALRRAGKKESRGRDDIVNMLNIFIEKGISGLEQALDDPSQLLPALAAMGLLDSMTGNRPESIDSKSNLEG